MHGVGRCKQAVRQRCLLEISGVGTMHTCMSDMPTCLTYITPVTATVHCVRVCCFDVAMLCSGLTLASQLPHRGRRGEVWVEWHVRRPCYARWPPPRQQPYSQVLHNRVLGNIWIAGLCKRGILFLQPCLQQRLCDLKKAVFCVESLCNLSDYAQIPIFSTVLKQPQCWATRRIVPPP
jgi:hypothetical protein